MKKEQKIALYENIMQNIASLVKKALNEELNQEDVNLDNADVEDEDADIIVFHPDYGKCAIRSAFEADTAVGDYYEVYCIEGDNEEYLCELPFDTDIDDEETVIAAIDDAIDWEDYKAENGINNNLDDEDDLDDEDLDDEDIDDEDIDDEDLDESFETEEIDDEESYDVEDIDDDEVWDDEDLDNEDYDEPKYTLVGCDGNAFAVMGYVTNAMKKEGKSQSEIRAYRTNAMASDYNNLLSVSMEVLDELNKK